MEDPQAIAALSALAHGHRLKLFRLLLRRGASGMPAGEIADAVGISPSSLTFHVGLLDRAGLLRSWRVHRNVFYAVDIDGMRRLMTFLTQDCCDGHPEICGGLGLGEIGCGPAAGCAPSEEVEP